MNWTLIIVVVAIFITMLLLKQMSFVAPGVARQHLAQGALVIDVRTAAEFNAGHLPGAINIPIDELEQNLPRRVGDKNQVLLLHCLSGTRSGVAKRQLNGMGYPNAFNLGSLTRARQIVNAARAN